MYEHVMEEVVRPEHVPVALAAVVRNGGAAGIDGMETTALESHLQTHWAQIRAKLLAGTYRPSPVRWVEIPKPTGGTRTLGIPTVQDRFIQHLMVQALTPIYEPQFSEHSYGFRPGRSAHDAVRAAQGYAREGHDWVVDLDITAFFDHVNHDLLLARIARTIRDKRVLRLIGRSARCGAMREGVVVRSEAGVPQGGPLSPLLANIYLDALDHELERRGHAFCRYADDCNIYVNSEAAAQRVADSIQRWIQRHLRLEVNVTKSGIGRPWERTFLGFRLTREHQIEVAPQGLARLKATVRVLWRSGRSVGITEQRTEWQQYIRGWWGYFQLAEVRDRIGRVEGWIRRHIRKWFWVRWHNWRGRRQALRQLRLRGHLLQTAHSGRGAWRVARSPSLHTALSTAVLRRQGFWLPSDLAGR